MKEIICRVTNDFDGVPWFMSEIARKEMLRVYNTWADVSDKWYALWNVQFHREFPGLDGFSKEYMSFIEAKLAEWYTENVRSVIFDVSKTTIDPESLLPVFKLRGFPKSKVTFSIKIFG